MTPYIQELIIGSLALFALIQTSRVSYWRAKAQVNEQDRDSLVEEINHHRERVDQLVVAVLARVPSPTS